MAWCAVGVRHCCVMECSRLTFSSGDSDLSHTAGRSSQHLAVAGRRSSRPSIVSDELVDNIEETIEKDQRFSVDGIDELNDAVTGGLKPSWHNVERLQFDVSEGGPWRISAANREYELCKSYPRLLLVPADITDEKLDAASKFRSSRRVPAIVWRHKGNGAVIARCSQPEVGLLGWRSSDDEELSNSILMACSNPTNPDNDKKLLIMDARSYATAWVNRARGGGCEYPEYYPKCEIQFMNLANIHAIRKSFCSLRSICWPSVDQPNWYSLLEGTRWLQNMAGLIHAAITLANAVENDGRPVLVHCSDGWDRTPQIVSLAQLLLDPYYRTIEGFRVLVEREWLEFGHKFADRCGLREDINERCPVFLQWLDCIHNIIKQYPCAFELNSNYLIKLAQHTYSNMFGMFLCNNSRERAERNIANRTFSVWNILQAPQFVNHLYYPQEQLLCLKYPTSSVEHNHASVPSSSVYVNISYGKHLGQF
ncbi:Myotubularin- protein 4 [Homalodisca vitripennis]|nr:Myotubularin- protein 4 [Homalodisca vitripennis]